MNRLMKLLIALLVTCGLGVSAISSGATTVATAKKPVASYALGRAKKCKPMYVKRTLKKTETVHIKIKGKTKAAKVQIRYIGCVYVAPISVTVTAPTPTTPSVPTVPTTTVPAPAPLVALDPTCMQAQNNPLQVSCSFSVSETNGSSIGGVLSFATTVVPNNQSAALTVSASPGCQINLSPDQTSSTCSVTYPSFGTYYMETLYDGGPDANSASLVEALPIEPQQLPSVTNVINWNPDAQAVTNIVWFDYLPLPSNYNPDSFMIDAPYDPNLAAPPIGRLTITDPNGDSWGALDAPAVVTWTIAQANSVGLLPLLIGDNEVYETSFLSYASGQSPFLWEYTGGTITTTITQPDGDYYSETNIYPAASGEFDQVYFLQNQ